MSCRLEILVNFGQVFALFFRAFIVDFEYSMSLNVTLWHIFGEHQVDVMFVGVIFNFYCFIAFPIGKTCSMSLMRFNNRTFAHFFISLLNLRSITKPYTHLHPAPSTSTQLISTSAQLSATSSTSLEPKYCTKLGNFPKFGPKNSELCILTEYWHTWYLDDSDSHSNISFLNFQP